MFHRCKCSVCLAHKDDCIHPHPHPPPPLPLGIPTSRTAATVSKVEKLGSLRDKPHQVWSDRQLLFFHATHDRDGDGNITRPEFVNMLITMGILSEHKAKLGSSLRAVSPVDAAPSEEDEVLELHTNAAAVFDEMDVDNSGALSANEFVEAYHRYLNKGKFKSGPSFLEAVADAVADGPEMQKGGDNEEVDPEKAADEAKLLQGRSKVVIHAIKWWPGDPHRGSEQLPPLAIPAAVKDINLKVMKSLESFLAPPSEGPRPTIVSPSLPAPGKRAANPTST